MRPGKRRALDKTRRSRQLIDQLERLKRWCYLGLKKSTAQLKTLFALSKRSLARKRLTSSAPAFDSSLRCAYP
jgi:transposase, IS5 family